MTHLSCSPASRRVAAFEAERPRGARTVGQLAETLLQQGRLQEAQTQYLRLAREFYDLPGFARLAQSRGSELGVPRPMQSMTMPNESTATQTQADPKVRALMDEELQMVEKHFKAGNAPAIELLKLQREALQLKQRIAAAEGSGPSRRSETTPKANEEPKPEAPKKSTGERP